MAKRTILVVDDEEDICFLMKARIESTGSFNVIVANTGKEGIRKAFSEKPVLILLDIMMPDGDGFEVLRKIRKNADTRYLPVIMLTGRRDSDSMFEAEALDVTDYLMKPIDTRQLLDLIKKHT